MRATDAGILILALMLSWSFYRAHQDPTSTFNIFDLIMDKGRVSKIAFAFLVTLGVTSWIMVRMTVAGKMTDLMFAAYGTMWVAPIIAKLFSPALPPSTTTDTTTTTHAQEIK